MGKIKNNSDVKDLAEAVVYKFLDKENITAAEANAVLAGLKLIKSINDETPLEDSDIGFELNI